MPAQALLKSGKDGSWFIVTDKDQPDMRWGHSSTWLVCEWCGKPLQTGERARWFFINHEGQSYNSFICYECGHNEYNSAYTDEHLIEKLNAVQDEFFRRFWYMNGSDYHNMPSRVMRAWGIETTGENADADRAWYSKNYDNGY